MTPSRQRILRAAGRLFVARGYNGISMREIAQAAAISKPGLYYHFQDKEDLFLAILTENLTQVEAILTSCRQKSSLAQERIACFIQAVFTWTPYQRSLIRLASQDIVHCQAKTRKEFSRLYQKRFISQLQTIFEEGVNSKELRPLNTTILTKLFMGLLYPFLFSREVQPPFPQEPLLEEILSVLFHGISATGLEKKSGH